MHAVVSRVFGPLVVLGLIVATLSAEPPPKRGVDLQWGLRIPMRDGVTLHGVLFRPPDATEPSPVLFVLTPYTSDRYTPWAVAFARRGYAFVIVDVRGRGDSEGTFEPFANDPHDGHDIVEWLARQPWCNGKVAMWGSSYMASTQWATIKEAPPHLVTIVPTAAAHPGVDFPFFNGIYYPYDIQWLTLTGGRAYNGRLYNDEAAIWFPKFTRLFTEHRPFRELDQVIGNTGTAFQTWVNHPTPDAYWDAMVPTAGQYEAITAPILTITGHYDADQAGAMAFYRRHMQHGNEAAKATHYLIIGPWDHAGTVTPKRDVKGLTFGEASVLDMKQLHQQWYDWTMRDGDKPAFLKNRIAYYVVGAGAETWKYAESLASIATASQKLYLHSDAGCANDVFQSGRLSPTPPGDEAPDSYVYDPLDTSPARYEQAPVKKPLLDQTTVMTLGERGVIYHSEPFAEATEVTGYLRLRVWMKLDVPDTDFNVAVYEILADGTSIRLTTDALRARYRESRREEKLVAPGDINCYVFETFNFFSRRIASGSRIRLALYAPNSIHQQKNFNAGGVVSDESGRDARTAHVTVYHDADHPSHLVLPVVR
jgi:putative CocE/NonD family hydrolase